MNRNISINLSAIGFSEEYTLCSNGCIVYRPAARSVSIIRGTEVVLKDNKGKSRRITLKKLYRQAFGIEYCKDNTNNLPNEIWKEVEGTNGRYFISNCGRLKSYCRYNAHLITPYKNQCGYKRADIWCNGKRETVLIHRLVAMAFVENDNPEVKDTVDHIDGDKNNNAASNLRWLSRSANVKAYFSVLTKEVQQ